MCCSCVFCVVRVRQERQKGNKRAGQNKRSKEHAQNSACCCHHRAKLITLRATAASSTARSSLGTSTRVRGMKMQGTTMICMKACEYTCIHVDSRWCWHVDRGGDAEHVDPLQLSRQNCIDAGRNRAFIIGDSRRGTRGTEVGTLYPHEAQAIGGTLARRASAPPHLLVSLSCALNLLRYQNIETSSWYIRPYYIIKGLPAKNEVLTKMPERQLIMLLIITHHYK